MTVKEALVGSNDKPLKKGMVGRELPDWCDIGAVEIKSGQLTAIDFGVLSVVDGVTVDVPTGLYLVQAKVMGFDGNLGISRARALPVGFLGSTSASPCGKVSVDFATIAIADIADAGVGISEEDFISISDQIYALEKLHGENVHAELVQLNLTSKTIELPCISSGLGDGTYPALSLSDNGKTIGIEVEFVKDGHVFGDPTTPGSRVLTIEEFLAEYKPPNATGSKVE